MYVKRSEDALDAFWTFFLHWIYVLLPGGNAKIEWMSTFNLFC